MSKPILSQTAINALSFAVNGIKEYYAIRTCTYDVKSTEAEIIFDLHQDRGTGDYYKLTLTKVDFNIEELNLDH